MEKKTKIASEIAATNTRAVGRVTGIDAAKVTASFAVVTLHVIGRGTSVINTIVYYLAGFAIPIFFMANGYFVITKTNISFGYVIKKTLRVIRLVILWSLILFLIGLINTSEAYGNPISIAVYAIAQRGPLWHFWFFGSLGLLWLLSPFLNRLLDENAAGYARVLVVMLALCLLVQGASIVGALDGRGALQAAVKQVLRLWTWIFYYMLGGYLSYLNKNGQLSRLWERINDKSRVLLLLISIVVIIWQAFIGYYILNLIRAEYYYDDISTILYSVLIFLMFLFKTYGDFANKLIDGLSPYTLGIYIVHPFVIAAIETMAVHSAFVNAILCPIVFFASFLCCLVLMRVRYLNYLVKI